MLKNDLILRNPLRVMDSENMTIPAEGGFGAVISRAGLGKTALLVQISLNSLLNHKNVLHISLDDPVHKVSLWYKEVFSLIATQYSIDQINELWESLLPQRFIMTFKCEGFSVPKLEERLADLMEQNIFVPQMIILDGLPFDENVREPLLEFKAFAKKLSLHAWFTIRSHRHEPPDTNGMPIQLTEVKDLFETVLQLQPQKDAIHIKALECGQDNRNQPVLFLDPSTMLIKKN